MKHYGDVSKINGSKVEPVDVITFGSPCQDLSVAGKRAGIQDGERSNLFFEAVRIIKEMREATNGEYPKYAVWENVPGAFSSNKGHDFHAVLEALCSVRDDAVSIPEPYDSRRTKLVWNKAGEIVGDNYSIAWRTLDAQYWGVPQRRKRIYLVADFTGRCAGEILFKQDGLRWHMSQGDETGQDVTADAVGGIDRSVGVECLNPWDSQTIRQYATNGVYPALNSNSGGGMNRQGVVYSFDSLSSNSMKSSNPNSGCRAVEIAKCIDTTYPDPSKNQGGIAIVEASCTASGKQCFGTPGILFARQRSDELQDCGVASTQSARQYKDATDLIVSRAKPPRKHIIRRLTPTECARLQGFPDWWGDLAPYRPSDAEFWEEVRKTYAEINGKNYRPVKDLKKWYEKLRIDSAEYKMWGNGIALPNAEYVLSGIAEQGARTLGSLFDGSGGFPLAGALNDIKPIWSSEVEPYPIAVTKSRFGGML